MAKATALALAAQIVSTLGLQWLIFLFTFFNDKEHTNPPHWEIKRLIHSFINHS